MKSVPKLIRRFVGILLLSAVLIVLINIAVLGVILASQVPDGDTSPYNMAAEAGKALQASGNGGYVLADNMSAELAAKDVWALLIDNDTKQAVWKTKNVPAAIPDEYTLADIADLSVGYLDGYPTYTGETENGIVVLGYPKNSFWKHTRASWNYGLIANFPQTVLTVLLANIVLILSIYVTANMKLLKSVKPITKGIRDLSAGERVHVPEEGVLSEISSNINRTSDILQKQETARANWIAGVSHDIRTPLSMVMGYAAQLENSCSLSEAERKKASVIVKQSKRMKNLINDLNLASKLEYNMQPLMKEQVNALAIVRQVVADFMNTEIEDKFPIQWETDGGLTACRIDADSELLKRAVSNLIQNSINHNANGCTIFVSAALDNRGCIICVEDNGAGAADEQIEKLNHMPHYMVCDTNTAEQRHGLGLLIVKQIIEGHNGSVTIGHSKYGGFKVSLVLPILKTGDSG